MPLRKPSPEGAQLVRLLHARSRVIYSPHIISEKIYVQLNGNEVSSGEIRILHGILVRLVLHPF